LLANASLHQLKEGDPKEVNDFTCPCVSQANSSVLGVTKILI
jgi:hypothetical protein